jgi:hypothetical protein
LVAGQAAALVGKAAIPLSNVYGLILGHRLLARVCRVEALRPVDNPGSDRPFGHYLRYAE